MGIVGTIAVALLVLIGGYAGTQWLVKKDTKIEERRRAAANLAGVLRGLGLSKTPEFLIDYSVGDYSGMGEKLVRLAELFLSGEKAVVDEFDKVFEKCLAAKVNTEQGRAYVAVKLDEAYMANTPEESS